MIIFTNFIFDLISVYLFCYFMFPSKKNYKYEKTKIIIVLVITFLKSCFSVLHNPHLNFMISILFYNFISIFFFREKIKLRILYVFLYFSFSILSEEISVRLFALLNLNIDTIYTNMLLYLFLSLIGLIFKIVLINIAIHIFNYRKDDIIGISDKFSLLLIPITTVLIFYLASFLIDSFEILSIKIALLVLIMLFLISNMWINYILKKSLEKNKLEYQYRLQIEKNRADTAYYDELIERDIESRKFRHDLKKHLYVLKEFLIANEINKAYNYLEEFVQSSNVLLTPYSCGNKCLDTVLNAYRQELSKTELCFKIEDGVDLSYISQIDSTVIFGNIISNAIRSCEDSANKVFIISFKNINDAYYVLKFENACDYAYKINNKYKTTKIDTNNHGIGLQNIISNVSKYKGTVKFHFNDTKKMFITTIILPH